VGMQYRQERNGAPPGLKRVVNTIASRLRARTTRVAAGSAVFMIALGLVVLAGWFSHTPALIQFGTQLPPMTRNAAACSVLCGVALLTLVLRGPRWLMVACSGVVSAVSILTILEYVFDVNVGIDDLLGPSYIAIRASSPGRIAPVAATCFALGSIVLLLDPKVSSKRYSLLLGITGSIVAACGLTSCMAFALGSSDAFGWGQDTRASLPAAVALCAFGFGMLSIAWHVETDRTGAARWLPISVAIVVAAITAGLWQALIAGGYPPFALLPVAVLGGGFLMAAIFGLTVYMAQHAHTRAVALRRSEARKAAILDAALDCIITMDHEGCITEFNPAAERTFGYRRDEVIGEQLADILIPPSLREQHRQGLARYVATGDERVLGKRIEMTAIRSDGSEFPVELAITSIKSNGPPLFTGYLRDITQRKASIERLQAKQDLLDLAQKSAGAMAFDWYIQDEVNSWSPEQEALFGLAPGTFDGTYKTWKSMMYAADWPTVVEAIQLAQQTGRVSAEYRVVWPDGSLHWLSTNGRMFFDDEGKPLRMVGFTSDVTRRKQAEEELRRSEAFLAEGQHLARMGNFSWRIEKNKITWSEQMYRIFGFEPGIPMTLELITTRVHPDDLPLMDDMVESAQRGVSDFEYEHRLLMPDNSVKYLHLVAHRSRDEQGRMEYIGAVQDVTQRHMSEEALGEARSELARVARITSLGVLTASIAHEVNQPLSGIITNANTCVRMLDADPPNVDGARETARRTIRDGNRASDVIARLRALFSKKDFTVESVDLNEAAREVIAMLRSELQSSQVFLQTEFAKDLPPVDGDRVQLQQVILNLLRNASDAMISLEGRPRRLLVRTECDMDRVILSVNDSGIGFDLQVMNKLFETFYTTKDEGMGIGLSVSKSIIENHQGLLWASPNNGSGATFSFSIPCGSDGFGSAPLLDDSKDQI
jgi:PAS domain S-box-containing protein